MEVVTLLVKVDKSQLGLLQTDITKLNTTPVKLRVDASGFAALDKNIVKNINSVTKFVNAAARLEKAQAQVQIAQQKTATATQQRMTAEARLAQQTARTATEEAKAATQAQRTATERAKLTTETQRTATAEARLAQQQEKTRTAQAQGAVAAQKAAASNAKLGQSAGQATNSIVNLGNSVVNSAKQMGTAMVTAALIYKPVAAFKEALETMKAVDAELVNVGKVTKWPKERLEEMGEAAYKTASQYGVAANNFLESVTEFTRAGYLGQSEALAELATKTQIVGDTTAEVANQFLLAVDKGYQMGGSVEKLSAVLDGANEIGNNFATSIPKIAEGLGKVAPIGAQAKVGIDELSAAIGTVTAVTQRSGTEAATALRALFLNIMGDTKTEIDEGVTWTTGEIKGLRDVLNIYASDVVAAADATGSLINPMEAIGALSQSMKDGVLTEQKLMEMVSDIGGKLRTSQLLALIQNWDMYEEMLVKYQNAAGSADREVERAMDSWTRKTEVLKNTWTQFVSHMVETDTIKGAITGLTDVLSFLDSGLGQTVLQLGMVELAITGITKGATGLTKVLAGTKIGTLFTSGMFKSMADFKAGLSLLVGAINPYTAAIAAAAAATVLIPKIIDAVTVSFEEQKQKVEDLKNEYKDLTVAGGELETLQKKMDSGEAMTNSERVRLSILKNQTEELLRQIELENQLVFDKFQKEYGSQRKEVSGSYREGDRTETTADVARLRELTKAQDEYNTGLLKSKMTEDEYRSALRGVLSDQQEYYENLTELRAEGMELSDAQKEFIAQYEQLSQKLSGVADGYLNARNMMDQWLERTDGGADKLRQFADDYQDFLTLYNQGMTGSNRYKGLVAELFPQDLLDELGGDYRAAGEMLANEFWQGVFSEGGEDYGANFANALYQVADGAGNIVDANGEVIASFAEVDGSLSMTIESIEGLAEYLGTTPELISALGEALGVFSGDVDTRGLLAMVEELNAVSEAADVAADGLMHIDLERLVQGMVEAGATAPDIQAAVGALQSANGISLDGPVASLGELIQKAQESQGKLDTLDETDADPTVDADTAPANAKLDALNSRLSTLSTTTTTHTVNVVTTETTSAKAEGDTNYRGGMTLVNELGPEIIREGDTARIAGGGKPTLTHIKPGAQIFNAQETRSILQGSAWPGAVPAMAVTYNNIPLYQTTPSSSSSSSKSSAGSAKKSSSSKAKKSGSSSAGGSGSSQGVEALQNDLELLKAQYSYLEASGAGADELTAKSKEIQNTLHNINEALRASNGEEKDILKNSTDWWKELETIHKVQQEAIQKERDLLESELNLMEKQGGSAGDRIAKLKQIQENLHREAEYLRQIGASQEEINKLSSEWWETQDDILKVQKDLWSELEDAVGAELKRAKKARDLEVEAIDLIIKQRKEERDAAKEEKEYQEKLLKVEEARAALANAQNERTVRTYNAMTGQWEWVADAKTVKDAEKSLKEAEEDLKEYEEDLAFEAAIKEMEVRREAIKEAYDVLEESWQDIIDSVQEPARDISDILSDLARNGTPLMKAQVENTADLLKRFNQYIEQAINDGGSYYKANGLLGVDGAGGGFTDMNFANDQTDYAALMANSTSEAAFNHYASLRAAKMAAQGIDPAAAGYQTNAEIYETWKAKNSTGAVSKVISSGSSSGGGSSSSKGSSTSSGSSNSSSGFKTVPSGSDGKAPAGLQPGDRVVTEGGTYVVTGGSYGNYTSVKASEETKKQYEQKGGTYSKYDSGGILRGLGGIKATARDEMVLPPDVTSAMLQPSADAVFQQRMAELKCLYGMPDKGAVSLAGTAGGTTYDHSGAEYHFGGMTFNESQAKSLTLHDLAQHARNLTLFTGK